MSPTICPTCRTPLETEHIGNPRTGPRRQVAYCPTCDTVTLLDRDQDYEPTTRKDLA